MAFRSDGGQTASKRYRPLGVPRATGTECVQGSQLNSAWVTENGDYLRIQVSALNSRRIFSGPEAVTAIDDLISYFNEQPGLMGVPRLNGYDYHELRFKLRIS